jgi:DNA-binding PadR family transcriptional regulator
MEFFLLAVIGRGGLSSLYELQKRAGLEPGGIRPALTRLEADGYLSRGEHEARNKRRLGLTTKGIHYLENNWWFSLQNFPDFESVLRATAVALLMGEPKTARTYLETTSFQRSQSGKQKEAEAGYTPVNSDALSFYRWMRLFYEAKRSHEEARVLLELRETVKGELYNKEELR